MTYQLVIAEPAESDRDDCFAYIAKRSVAGATRWLDAFNAAVSALLIEPHYGESPKARDFDEAIRQKLFKTRHGRTYRILYVLRDDTIYLLHVRGPGQDLMHDDEIKLPENLE